MAHRQRPTRCCRACSNVEGNGIRDAMAAQQLVQQIQFNGMVRARRPPPPSSHTSSGEQTFQDQAFRLQASEEIAVVLSGRGGEEGMHGGGLVRWGRRSAAHAPCQLISKGFY